MNCDVVFIAMENWDGVWRRNQPVAAGFATRGREHKVLFVGLSIDASHMVRKGRFGALVRAFFSRQLRSPAGFDNIYILNCLKLLPNTLSWTRAINRWHERLQIRRAMRKLSIEQPLLWINPYYAVHTLGRLGEQAVIYDVGDDWTSFPQPSEWLRKQVISEDVELTERADATIVVSKRLFEMKRGQARRLQHIPNGVYVERYAGVCDRKQVPHPIARGWTRPVFAYTGSVHQDRIDIDLVSALSRAMPDATIALIGPNMLNPASVKQLGSLPNVRIPGPVEFEQMPQVMSSFDACIVPHHVNDFTESLSPLKLYEYLASGLPTISTPVSGFRDFPELVYLAKDKDSFVAACKAALSEPASLRHERQRTAAEHSWDARLDEIESVIASTCATEPQHDMHPIATAHAQ